MSAESSPHFPHVIPRSDLLGPSSGLLAECGCSEHHQCIRSCLDSLAFNPGCPYGCLQSVSEDAQAFSAPLTACVLSVCGPEISGDCYDSAINSICNAEAAACGVVTGSENCSNGTDDDGNGLVTARPGLFRTRVLHKPAEFEGNCSDGKDDDGDSLRIADLDCIGVGVFQFTAGDPPGADRWAGELSS